MAANPDGRILIYSIGGFFFGLFWMYSGLSKYRLAQKIRNTPTSKVDAAAVGLVELMGKAACKGSMASPITKQKCAYWKIVSQYYQSGKHGGWRKLVTEDSSSDLYDLPADSDGKFYLDDGTGKMLIDPVSAEVDIPQNNLFEGSISGKGVFGMDHPKIDDRVLAYIDRCEESTKKRFMDHQHLNVRFYEYYLADGDPLYVLGTAEPLDGTASGTGYENLVVRKSKTDNTMYMSDTGEDKILDKLGGFTYLHIFGGLALSAVCLLIILGYLGVL